MLIGLGIAGYLLAVRVAGGAAACGPSHGCETVAASEYATVGGIPVAAWGFGFQLALAGLALKWWRSANRTWLLLAYLGLLAGTIAVAWLTFLELFVIEAVCLWCAGYAVAVLLALATAALALRRSA